MQDGRGACRRPRLHSRCDLQGHVHLVDGLPTGGRVVAPRSSGHGCPSDGTADPRGSLLSLVGWELNQMGRPLSSLGTDFLTLSVNTGTALSGLNPKLNCPFLGVITCVQKVGLSGNYSMFLFLSPHPFIRDLCKTTSRFFSVIYLLHIGLGCDFLEITHCVFSFPKGK